MYRTYILTIPRFFIQAIEHHKESNQTTTTNKTTTKAWTLRHVCHLNNRFSLKICKTSPIYPISLFKCFHWLNVREIFLSVFLFKHWKSNSVSMHQAQSLFANIWDQTLVLVWVHKLWAIFFQSSTLLNKNVFVLSWEAKYLRQLQNLFKSG